MERHTLFRGATSDVAQCGVRSNFDFQFMPRAPVLAADKSLDEELRSAEKPEAEQDANAENATRRGRDSPSKKTLTYDRAEAFYGIRLQLPADVAMRRAAYSMLAMWQAAHNTDYYITKYGTKPLEQLQNLIAQFALGLRRLELEEQQERDAEDAVVVETRKPTSKELVESLYAWPWQRTGRRGLHAARWPCLFAQELMSERHIIPETSTSAVWHTCAIHVYVS